MATRRAKAAAPRRATRPVKTGSEEVDAFMKSLDHPFRAEVSEIRRTVMNAHKGVTEEIKWAAPTFSYKGYIVSFNLFQKKFVQMVFHNGVILKDETGLLQGTYPDRRLAHFKDMKEVRAKKPALVGLIRDWVRLMDARGLSRDQA